MVIVVCLFFALKGKARDWASDNFKNIYVKNYQDDEEGVADFFQEKVILVQILCKSFNTTHFFQTFGHL